MTTTTMIQVLERKVARQWSEANGGVLHHSFGASFRRADPSEPAADPWPFVLASLAVAALLLTGILAWTLQAPPPALIDQPLFW